MAEVRPFRGLRYDPAVAGELSRLVAPPYDVISPAQQRALNQASPYNAIHLELNEAPAEERYAAAARLLADWRRHGVLRPDAEAAFYLYEQRFQRDGRRQSRRTLFAAVRAEPFETGSVRPHEFTLSGPKEDRLRLLRATRMNTSPVFSLYRSDLANPLHRVREIESSSAASAVDMNGDEHLLSPLTDPELIASLRSYLGERTLYIADGHHRYETALRYLDDQRSRGGGWTGEEPENFVLMGLTADDDPGLLILPIHRIVHLAPPAGALERIERAFDVTPLPEQEAIQAIIEPLEAQRIESGTAFVAAGLLPDRLAVLRLRDASAAQELMPVERSAAWKRLDVSLLQYAVLQAGLGIDLDTIAAGGAVEFSEDAREAIEAVQDGRASLAFLLRATRPADIFAVADRGDRMPQKSTYFYPKLGTGLVFYAMDASPLLDASGDAAS